MKKIAILGSTGQIGSQALEIIRSYPDQFQIIGLSCRHPSAKFDQQVAEFKPEITAITQIDGPNSLDKIATHPDVELLVVATVGLSGLNPTLLAINKGKNIALATKEVLVIAGEYVLAQAKKNHVNIFPIDSEHSAIWQCLHSGKKEEINHLILTMGSGPIAKMTSSQLDKVTLKDILNRPVWDMGQKIAVDSATGINKTFEVIEAGLLFDLPPEKIQITVHPQYFCHSLIEFIDGSIIGEFGVPDMKRYIQYALFYPDRKLNKILSPPNIFGQSLEFKPAPFDKFPCLQFGFDALKRGGNMPAILHGADTTAVQAFLDDKIKFTDIPKVIQKTMETVPFIKSPDIDQIINSEKAAFNQAIKFI